MHASIIYVRIVLINFKSVLRCAGRFGPLPTSVGRTLLVVIYTIADVKNAIDKLLENLVCLL